MSKIIETSRRVFLERKSLQLDSDYTIISITNPGDPEAKLDHLGCKVYRFVFDDIEEFNVFYPNPITDFQAKDILNILQNYNKIIVHCEMAYSRSPAVAIFAKNYLDFDWVNYTEDCMPNKLVYQKLVDLWKNSKN